MDSQTVVGNLIAFIVIVINVFGLSYLILLFAISYWKETGKELVQKGIAKGREKIQVKSRIETAFLFMDRAINNCRCCKGGNESPDRRSRNSWHHYGETMKENDNEDSKQLAVGIKSMELQIHE